MEENKNKDKDQMEDMTEEMEKVDSEEQEQNEQIIPEPGDAEFSGGEENLDQRSESSPELLALEEEKKSLIDRLARLQADFDNHRRRVAQEKEELRARANEKLLAQMLPILDNFERALSAEQSEGEGFVKGVELIYRQILSMLEKEGVVPMDVEGEHFDPNLHHAVIKEPAEGVAEDTIIGVLQKGYYYKERVLRPAMVKVAE